MSFSRNTLGLVVVFSLTGAIALRTLANDEKELATYPKAFICTGETRDFVFNVSGILVSSGDIYSATLNTSLSPDQDMTGPGPIAQPHELYFSIEHEYDKVMSLMNLTGRRTTVIEIGLAPEAPSYIDDGTIFFLQEMICDLEWESPENGAAIR